MKQITKIFQALLGVATLLCTTMVAIGRLCWHKTRNWWKKRSKWFRRAITTILLLFVGFYTVMTVIGVYNSFYGRDWWDKQVSKHVSLHSFADGKYRVYNNVTGKYTTEKIKWLSETSENDSLAVYAIHGRRGYINTNTGEIVIKAEENAYTKAWIFSEGLAAVMKNGKVGFINKENKMVIPFKFDFLDKVQAWDFGYAFHDGFCTMTNADGDVGLIDSTGVWVVEPEYDEIWRLDNNGYRIVIDDYKYGIIDKEGIVVQPAKYEYINIVSNGFIFTNEGRMWQTDFDCNIIQPFMFDGTYWLNYPIGYNESGEIKYAFADYAKYKILYCYGLMNRLTGEPLTPAIYADINMLSENVFEVQDCNNYDWHLIDANGKAINK